MSGNRGGDANNVGGAWSDIISDFMEYTENAPSPEIFRLWSAISLVGGACERRIWTISGEQLNFPSLYVLLVGRPGTGKSIINTVKDLWRDVVKPKSTETALHVASDSLTRASLIDELADSTTKRIVKFDTFTYHSLLVAAEEFEVLLPTYDSPFISVLNDLWNVKPWHIEKRRHGPAKVVTIENPQLHLLGGVQPAYFTGHWQEQAWSTGLARRAIMIYAAAGPRKNPFQKAPNRQVLKNKILKRLSYISEIYQEVRTPPAVERRMLDWYDAGCPPEPDHSKLASYNTTRFEFLIKLSLISCVSRVGGSDMAIDEYDVTRALGWLLQAEKYMSDIFTEMAGRSDGQVLEEFHRYVMRIWTQTRAPIKTSILIEFLSMQLPSDKVHRNLQVAVDRGIIARAPNTVDSWLPRPNLRLIHGE